MRLFGRKSGSAPARPALARTMTGWVPDAAWPRSYDGQIRDALNSNPVAQRAIRLVGESVRSLSLVVTGAPETVADLLKPAIEAMAIHLLLHGNGYVTIACDMDGDPLRLHVLRPERVTAETDAQGWPSAYCYRVGAAVQRLPIHDGMGKPGIVHLRGFNPIDDQYGLGCLDAGDRAQWRAIHDAAFAAQARGTADTFIWALPQAMRDGFTLFAIGDEEGRVQAFDDMDFPIAIGRRATVEPCFSTAIVTTAAGREQRNADWADARLRFDAGPGVRSQADVEALIGFFRARHGAARGFRFRDPLDHSSWGMTGAPGAGDQAIGTGDGVAMRFALVKMYGDQMRRITRPVAGSVRVAVDGVERTSGWALADGGMIAFDVAPPVAARVTAGFLFDVPVRFAEDRLETGLATFAAGEVASVPLVEIREG